MTMETAQKVTNRPARKSWVYGILLVMFLGVVVYFGLMNIQDRSKNQDYYRVLYEASNTFKENLHKLESMHEYEESATSIRSLLPSYSRTPFTEEEKLKTKRDKLATDYVSNLGYVLNGKQLKYINEDFSASLLIEDILPTPKKGFSQYLFADEGGNVLAPIGGERTISIVDLSSINQEIQRKSKQFQFNLTDAKQGQPTGQPAPLPSYSNHVDMKISYGEFRVYVFPFRLNTPLRKKTDTTDNNKTLNNLYLVGLLPKHELAARDSGHWNVSLLVVTIISLLFMWSMLRLYLLPKNQSITKIYRVIANVSSYLFYIVIVALVLAYFQKSLLQNIKDHDVVIYADKLNEDITSDLFDIFSGLNNHRRFYLAILKAFSKSQEELAELNKYTVTDPLITDISAVVNQEITNAQTSVKLNRNTILEGIKTAIDKELKQLEVLDAEKREALGDNIFEVVSNELSISQTSDTNKEDALLKVITETVNKEFLPLYRLDPKTREGLVAIITNAIIEGITQLNILNDIDELTVNKLKQFPYLNVVVTNSIKADINQAVFYKLRKPPNSDKLKKKTFAIDIVNAVDNEFKKLFISNSQKKEALVNVIDKTVFNQLEKIVNSDNPNIQTDLPQQYFHMGSAATSKRKYSLVDIGENKNEQDKTIPLRLDVDAISVLVNAVKINKAGVNTLDFFSQLQTVDLQPNESLETYISKVPNLPLKNKLLSVFAMNGEGNLILPSFYYQESNSLPETYNLSHRNYFKQVRDHKGWDLKLTSKTTPSYKNIYIQRLLNLNNGTRGTTVSMPMNDQNKDQSERIGNDHIIAADVLLPSLSLRTSPILDFTYMIVERSSGEVLFHKDTERSLVENLYFSGDSGNKISQKIKAGLEQNTDIDDRLFSGSYHGQTGRFALSPTIVNEWAIVIFYPDDTLLALMTNQFLFISVSFALTMALMMSVIYAIRYKIWTSALKEKLVLPFKLNVRFVMLVSSVMLSTSYCLHLLGANIDLLYKSLHFSILLPLLGIVLTTVLVYLGCTKLFSFPPDVSDELTRLKSKRGAIGIISTVLIITCAHFYYVHRTSTAQLKSLDKYYQQLECISLNYERVELNSTGLSRYPQSITAKRIDPLLLLPLQDDWYKNLRGSNSDCDNQFAASSNPEDFPSMGSLTGSTGVWRWINNFLWTDTSEENDEEKDQQASKDANLKADEEINNRNFLTLITFLQGLLLIAIIAMWFKFNTRILWYRLYCPERFMQHITRMTESVRSLETEAQNKQLRIECDTVKLNGVGLNLLLRSMSLNTTTKSKPAKRVLVEGFAELFEMSPCLQSFSQEKSVLPNLKLNLDSDPTTGLLNVHIWDIETCLEKGVFRQLLLDLIMELKSLTVANQLHSFTIFAGFHSLQRVKMKDPLSQDNSSLLATAEYLSWSECLMDFVVVLPDSFKRGVDWELLESEVEAFPELKYLVEPYDQPKQKSNWSDVLKRDEELYQEGNWATINYLLLNSDALYRFKWESCSSAEKLALINLAKQNRINPMNTQMIEHLALNGLITVRKGHLDIVNRSFAHFVLHAETRATLNQLVSYGEAGIWKNYKLPIGIMILLIIGGIALTSGESIYIIAASMAGVLGTVVSVTNSANMLRGGPKD